MSIVVGKANRHDMKLTESTLENIKAKRPEPSKKKQNLCLDKGYDFDEVRGIVKEFGFTAHIPRRGKKAQKIKRSARKKARRWVVERTHSWLNRFRALLVRWTKRPDAYIALLHLACGIITWRSTGLLR